MSLVWADPFDQYGTAGGSNSFMLNAGYSAVNVSSFVTGRTGPRAINLFNSQIRRPLNNTATTLGQGAACALQSCSGVNVNSQGFGFESAGPTMECRVVVQPDNSIGVWDRTSTLKGSTAPNTLIPGSFFWIEAKATGNVGGVVGTGTVEVRVNGITKLIVNGINLPNAFAYHSLGGSTAAQCFWDDYIVWDGAGANPATADFMGDRRLFISYPNANLATQDFTPSVAPAYDRINDSPPVDTSYIEGAAAGNVSEFSKDLIGISSTDIAAVVVMGRLLKSDAGTASGRIGINSNGFVQNSPELFPGTTGANFQFVIEQDPNGNIPWTRAAVDAAALRVTRVS